jgi:hypothetical protein
LFVGENTLHLLHHLIVQLVMLGTESFKIKLAGLALAQERDNFFALGVAHRIDSGLLGCRKREIF